MFGSRSGTTTNMSMLKRLAADRSGNFGMMTALMLPVLFGAAGFAIDFTNAMQVKSNLQSIADAASLAGASAMAQDGYTKAQAEKLAKDYFVAQIIASGLADATTTDEKTAAETKLRAATTATATETSSSSKSTYTVKLDTLYALSLNPITGVFAGKTMNIGINSTATTGTDGNDSRTGMSMYLALDRSGSMSFATTTVDTTQTKCVNYTASNWKYKDESEKSKNYIAPSNPCYVRKIDALKTAAAALFTSLNKTDTTSTLVRTGAISYNDAAQTASAIEWGTSKAATYVKALPSVPTGGTDATGAMTTTYNALVSTNTTEAKAHKDKNNTTFNRYIVLMTDGEMTGNSSDWNATIDKKVRLQCDEAKKDGIKIFTVAFMAPDNGKSLLKYCATSTEYYYSPEDMSALVTAFGEIAEKAAKQTVRLTN